MDGKKKESYEDSLKKQTTTIKPKAWGLGPGPGGSWSWEEERPEEGSIPGGSSHEAANEDNRLGEWSRWPHNHI